tara:strand:- start:601 stop:1035 length:435 start_codon:yes stop_codon:yes gene_type:complete
MTKRSVLVLPSMREKLSQSARSSNRSLNQQILFFLKTSLDNHPVIAPGSITKLPTNEGVQLVFRLETTLDDSLRESAAKRGINISKDIRDRLHLGLAEETKIDGEWEELASAIESITESGLATCSQAENLKLAWKRYLNAARTL